MDNMANKFARYAGTKKRMADIAVSFFVICFFAIFFLHPKELSITDETNEIRIGTAIVKIIALADTPLMQYNGLSNYPEICDNCGMLFIFPGKEQRTFVMRKMLFPLDIIWINGDSIVKIDKNLSTEGSEPKNYYESSEPVDKVLEVNAGFCDRNNIKIGDKLE